MSFEQGIHEQWTADVDLSAVVPPSRLFTGAALGGGQMPYVVLTRQHSKPRVRTSSGTRIEETLIRLSVWSEDLDQAKQIGRVFDDVGFELPEGDVRCMRRVDQAERVDDAGSWNIVLDYMGLVEHHTTGA